MKKNSKVPEVLVLLLIGVVVSSGLWWFFAKKGGGKVKIRPQSDGGMAVVFDENLSKTLSFDTLNVLRVEIHHNGKTFVTSKQDRSSPTWTPKVAGEGLVQLLNLLARIHFQERVQYKQASNDKRDESRASLQFVNGENWEAVWTKNDIWWKTGSGRGYGTTLKEDQRLLLETSWEGLLKPSILKLCSQPLQSISIESTKGYYTFEKNQWVSKEKIKDLNNRITDWMSQFCEVSIDSHIERGAIPEWQSVDRFQIKDISGKLVKIEVFQNSQSPEFYIFTSSTTSGEMFLKSSRLTKAYLSLLELSKK